MIQHLGVRLGDRATGDYDTRRERGGWISGKSYRRGRRAKEAAECEERKRGRDEKARDLVQPQSDFLPFVAEAEIAPEGATDLAEVAWSEPAAATDGDPPPQLPNQLDLFSPPALGLFSPTAGLSVCPTFGPVPAGAPLHPLLATFLPQSLGRTTLSNSSEAILSYAKSEADIFPAMEDERGGVGAEICLSRSEVGGAARMESRGEGGRRAGVPGRESSQ